MEKLLGTHPRQFYPAALERPAREFAPRDEAAEAAFLAGAAMFDCTRFPGTARISERQCLINQERAASSGFPSFCLECPPGGEIKLRHPEGSGQAVKHYCIDGTQNRPAELKAAREAKGRETGDGVPTSPEKPVRDLVPPPPPEPEKAVVMSSQSPTLPEKVEQLIEAPAPPQKAVVFLEAKLPGGKAALLLTPEDGLCLEVEKVWHRPVSMPPTAVAPKEPKELLMDNEAPRCPTHSEEPQVQAKGPKRAGQYLGRCKICLAAGARAAAEKRKANNAARRQAAAEIPPSPPSKGEEAARLAASLPSLGQAVLSEFIPPAPQDFRLRLLAKFPDFNPAWSPEMQGKWLDGFGRLCDLVAAKSAGGGRLTSLSKAAQARRRCHRNRPKWGNWSRIPPGPELKILRDVGRRP